MREPDFQFTVHSEPAPQGSKSAYVNKKTGRAVVTEDNARTHPWRREIVAAVIAQLVTSAESERRLHRTWKPLEGPIHLAVEFYLPRAKSRSKTRRELPDVKPDLDKLIRSTDDALKTAGVLTDDAQVTDLTLRKRFAVTDDALGHPWELPGPGAVISLFRIDPDDTWADEPIEQVVARTLPERQLPPEIHQAVTPGSRAELHEELDLLIGASTTDAAAAKLIDKALGRRHYRRVVIERGHLRLASVTAKPLSAFQSKLIGALPLLAERGTSIELAEVVETERALVG